VQQSDAKGNKTGYHSAGNWLDASLSSAPATAVRDAMQSDHWRPNRGQGLRREVQRAHESPSPGVSKWSECGLVCQHASQSARQFAWVCL